MICKEIFPLIKIKAWKSAYIPCGNISTKHKNQHGCVIGQHQDQRDGDQIMNRQGKLFAGISAGMPAH